MKYSTVEIKRKAFGEPGFRVSFADLPHEREPSKGMCSSLGFFHYPRKLGKKKAFEQLKAQMIQDYIEAIAKMQREILALNMLTMEE